MTKTYTSDEVWEMLYSDLDFRDIADWGNEMLRVDHPEAYGKIEFGATLYGETLYIIEDGMATGLQTNRIDKWCELVSCYFSSFEPENEKWTEQDITDFVYAILTTFLSQNLLGNEWEIEPKIYVNENILIM